MVARGNGSTRVGIATLVSPAVLLKNALGFTVAGGSLPATTGFTWISFFVIAVGALVLATWVFLAGTGCRNMGGHKKATMDPDAQPRGHCGVSSGVCRSELRTACSTGEQCTADPGAVRTRQRQCGHDVSGRGRARALLQYHRPESGYCRQSGVDENDCLRDLFIFGLFTPLTRSTALSVSGLR